MRATRETAPARRGASAGNHANALAAAPDRWQQRDDAGGGLHVEWTVHPDLAAGAPRVPSWARQPVRFGWGERLRHAVEVLDRWPGEHACDFRVRADDGATYILRYCERERRWELVFFQA